MSTQPFTCCLSSTIGSSSNVHTTLHLLPLLNHWLIVKCPPNPSLAASPQPLAHRQMSTQPFTCCLSSTIGSSLKCSNLSRFYRYYFGRCSSELAILFPLPYSWGRSTRYSDRLHDFSVTISRCYRDVYVNSFFPHTARLWNSVLIECFPLNYNLSGCKSRINRHLLIVGSF